MTTVARTLNEINVDRALLDQVLTIIGREAILSGNAALERAVERARQHIACGISWTLRGDVLTVDSASTPGDQYSLSIESGCACETQSGCCWHRGLLVGVLTVQTMLAALTATQPLVPPALPHRTRRACAARSRVEYVPVPRREPMSNAEYARACAAVDELY